MLKFNLTRIFKARGIDRPFTFLCNSGYSQNTATKMSRSNMVTMNLRDVEKLCLIFNCTPNDMLDWTPSSKEQVPTTHPLYQIKRNAEFDKLADIINSVPINKLEQVKEMIEKIKNDKDNS